MKILVAVDGSAHSDLASAEAASLAAMAGAEVTLVAVSTVMRIEAAIPLSTLEFTALEAERDLRYEVPSHAEAWVILEGSARRFRDAGVEPVLRHLHGDAAAKILELAASWRADLIVMGSHGRTGIARFLLGSVSEKVSRHAVCSVMISRGEELRFLAPDR